MAKFGCKRRAPNKNREVGNGFRSTISKICFDSMELSELKNQFARSGAYGNVNALADRGTIKPLAQSPKLQTLASTVLSQVCNSLAA